MAKSAKSGDSSAEVPTKKSRNRSPNHPLINLEDAIAKAKELHGDYGVHPITVAQAHKKWEYAEHGSSGNQCVAALKAYGLLEVAGQGKERKVNVSSTADRIIRNAPDRDKLIKDAVVLPAIHAEILAEHKKTGLPHDDILRQHLVWERKGGRFNEDVVDPFIARLRETLTFAGLGNGQESDGGPKLDTPKNETDPESSPGEIKVGSLVQWTSQGVDQFPALRPVLHIEIDNDGNGFARFEEEGGYVPVSELTLEKPKNELKLLEASATPSSGFEAKEGMAEVSYKLDEGRVRLEWPDELSKESVDEFEYWVKGLINRAKRKAGILEIGPTVEDILS